MLKHMARPGPTPDHLRMPSNGLSDSGASDHVSRRLLTSIAAPVHSMPNGYVSPGRYSMVGSKMAPSQHQQMQHQQQQLHVSLLNSSKHSLSPTTSVSPGTTANHTKTTLSNLDHSRDDSLPLNFSSSNGGPLCSSIFIPDRSLPNGNHTLLSNSGMTSEKEVNQNGRINGGLNIRNGNLQVPPSVSKLAAATRQVSANVIGVREMLISLGLLCLLSLLMALLALVFLLKMSPPPDIITVDQVRIISPEEQGAVYEVSLALCSLSLTLDVCCCLVCAAQLLFAARLITSSSTSISNSSRERIRQFLRDSSITRICAIAAFFLSIPVFLTDIVLYTILQFPSTPAITTSILISVGIVLCGNAMLHNMIVWQRHKKSNLSEIASILPDLSIIPSHHNTLNSGKIVSPSHIPTATLDLSVLAGNTSANLSNHNMHELSTLV